MVNDRDLKVGQRDLPDRLALEEGLEDPGFRHSRTPQNSFSEAHMRDAFRTMEENSMIDTNTHYYRMGLKDGIVVAVIIAVGIGYLLCKYL